VPLNSYGVPCHNFSPCPGALSRAVLRHGAGVGLLQGLFPVGSSCTTFCFSRLREFAYSGIGYFVPAVFSAKEHFWAYLFY